jgi:hypothetical protein
METTFDAGADRILSYSSRGSGPVGCPHPTLRPNRNVVVFGAWRPPASWCSRGLGSPPSPRPRPQRPTASTRPQRIRRWSGGSTAWDRSLEHLIQMIQEMATQRNFRVPSVSNAPPSSCLLSSLMGPTGMTPGQSSVIHSQDELPLLHRIGASFWILTDPSPVIFIRGNHIEQGRKSLLSPLRCRCAQGPTGAKPV